MSFAKTDDFCQDRCPLLRQLPFVRTDVLCLDSCPLWGQMPFASTAKRDALCQDRCPLLKQVARTDALCLDSYPLPRQMCFARTDAHCQDALCQECPWPRCLLPGMPMAKMPFARTDAHCQDALCQECPWQRQMIIIKTDILCQDSYLYQDSFSKLHLEIGTQSPDSIVLSAVSSEDSASPSWRSVTLVRSSDWSSCSTSLVKESHSTHQHSDCTIL